MAGRLLELTRVEGGSRRTSVLVNVDTVAWMESDDSGATRIVFASGARYDGEAEAPLAMLVGESLDEIARMSSAVRKSDDDAIAQAWADQTARRPSESVAP